MEWKHNKKNGNIMKTLSQTRMEFAPMSTSIQKTFLPRRDSRVRVPLNILIVQTRKVEAFSIYSYNSYYA